MKHNYCIHNTSPVTALPQLPIQTLAQVLVVDCPNGPAALVMGVVARLLPGRLSFTVAPDGAALAQALACRSFDLVLLGITGAQSPALARLAQLRAQCPDLTVLVVVRAMPPFWRTRLEQLGIQGVFEFPQRVAALKQLVRHLAHHYFRAALTA